jgi:hypothetical protein
MTASLSNNDLDKLALESDARLGERMLAKVYGFLGRFISIQTRTLMSRTHCGASMRT